VLGWGGGSFAVNCTHRDGDKNRGRRENDDGEQGRHGGRHLDGGSDQTHAAQLLLPWSGSSE